MNDDPDAGDLDGRNTVDREAAEAALRAALIVAEACLREFGVDDPALCEPTPGEPDPAAPERPTIRPGEVGAIAVARLQLPTLPPGVGPEPWRNRWDMVAVGYPLWLWTDGPTELGPVTDSVAGIEVSLTARVVRSTYNMGDGATVRCQGGGTPWTMAVEPMQPSPGCGYTFQQPSLPRSDYTVRAISFWAVTWTVNGTSGVITVPRGATLQLPVGELQAVIVG